ncbi:phosphotransferase enzyme family protein [Acidaminobacter sp. JC074]|uniref:phosphotransferase enzyme family protein n=1 Tax=Acidaminobacter sp. JC074 TaxID=2530199 RepID=UPI001F0F82F7|nr:aminoglycoside phosphotransferase family protein [Acidaminobacter sp. JC074]
MRTDIKEICSKFSFEGHFKSAVAYGDGHINDTYKVTYLDEFENENIYILQRVNHTIFTETEVLMENIEVVTSYLSDIVKDEMQDDYQVLTLVRTLDNQAYFKSELGEFFRAYIFVKDSIGYTFTENVDLLYEAGKAFGEFQKLLKDFPADRLGETIKDFHHTPIRYEKFEKIVKDNPEGLNQSCLDEIKFVRERVGILSLITDGLASKAIPLRVTHNDTKLNNVLMDVETHKGLCVIDLDTVMPGSALYDFGDAIRSCGSTVAEDEEDLDKLDFNMERFEAFSKGFLSVLKDDFTSREIELLPMAAILMTLECGIRFITDYLEGDVYFKVHKEKHNLIRAKNQFRFVEVMEERLEAMQSVVSECCK